MKYIYMSVVVPLCVLLPMGAGIMQRRYLAAAEKIILFYLFFSALFNALTALLAYNKINNLVLFHIYSPAELCFIVYFFSLLLQRPAEKKALNIIMAVFVAFAIFNSVYMQQVTLFNTYTRSLEAIIIIGICMYYFRQQLKNDGDMVTSAGFWMALGFFIYFSASLTIFILSNISLQLDKHFDWVMWNVHATMLLIMYLLITKGFLVCKK